MKTTINIKSGMGTGTEQLSWVRSLCKKMVKFFDGLILKYYYRGERLRPEVRAEMEKDIADARQGRNVSPAFSNAKDMAKWLQSYE